MSLPVRGAWIEIVGKVLSGVESVESLPVRGAWIEIEKPAGLKAFITSLPVRGAWIEICLANSNSIVNPSRSPCGERGLK